MVGLVENKSIQAKFVTIGHSQVYITVLAVAILLAKSEPMPEYTSVVLEIPESWTHILLSTTKSCAASHFITFHPALFDGATFSFFIRAMNDIQFELSVSLDDSRQLSVYRGFVIESQHV